MSPSARHAWRAVPVVVAALLAGSLAIAWALGTPDYGALTARGAAPALPVTDSECAGHVITADPEVTDVHFAGAAVLLCVHNPGGALGFIINRPTDEHVRAVLPGASWTAGRLGFGGPVGRTQGAVIYRLDGDLRFTTAALDAPFPATGWARAPRVPDRDILYVVAGYAGWNAGQLEGEIEAGGWMLTDVRPEVFRHDPRPPWARDAGSGDP